MEELQGRWAHNLSNERYISNVFIKPEFESIYNGKEFHGKVIGLDITKTDNTGNDFIEFHPMGEYLGLWTGKIPLHNSTFHGVPKEYKIFDLRHIEKIEVRYTQ